MKYIIITLVSVLFIGCAGSLTQLPDDTIIQSVIDLEDKTKDELYVKSMEWLSKTFNESKSVIDYQDKEAGTIIGNGAIQHFYSMIINGQVLFAVKLELKDNRARITLSNFMANIIGTSGPPVTRAIMQSEYDAAKPNLDKLVSNYEIYMKSTSTSNDDW